MNIVNEGLTALWPIYVDKETGKIIDTVTNMMRPVDPIIIKSCQEMCKNVQSDALRTLMIEFMLTFNNDLIKDNVEFILIAHDTKTQEMTDFANPSDKMEYNERMSHLINLVENIVTANDGSGYANMYMTILANVVARYCAESEENKESFNKVIEFWKDKLK